MKKIFEGISKGILYFLGGIIFTLFLLVVVTVMFLYNENVRLNNEINNLKNKVSTSETQTEIQQELKKVIPESIYAKPEEEVQQSPVTAKKGINWGNWNNLKNNMSENEVIKLLGNPSQIISKIETTVYIYKDDVNRGTVEFNRQMRVISWSLQ